MLEEELISDRGSNSSHSERVNSPQKDPMKPVVRNLKRNQQEIGVIFLQPCLAAGLLTWSRQS